MPRRSAPPPSASQVAPPADHHQHLFSPALAALYAGSLPAITAEEVVGLLDAAGISLALVLSGAAQAGVFLEELLPAAAAVPVQVAHLADTGPGYDDPPADTAMGVLAEAVERGDPRTDRLWFDVATIAPPAMWPPNAALAARRIRQVGVGRILYGSDAAAGDNARPREGWAAFRRLPLDDDEFARIASNVATHLL